MINFNNRKLERTISAYLMNIPIKDTPEARDRLLTQGWNVMEESLHSLHRPLQDRQEKSLNWRMGKMAAIGALLAIIIIVTLPHWLSKPTWAVEQSIKAIQDFHGLYIEGTFLNERGELQDCEMWIRASRTGRQSKDLLMKTSSGTICWTAKAKTYYYIPGQETVFYEQAVTAGMTPWPGPYLLKLLSMANSAQISHTVDPSTGRKSVTLSGNISDVKGPQAWSFNFDLETKKPISFKTWNNFTCSGPPSFWARQITYSRELSDTQMTPTLPEGVKYVEKEPIIQNQNLALLASPRFGILMEGKNPQEAATEILHRVYTAIMRGDIAQVRHLCPLTELWSDEFLKGALMDRSPGDRIQEVISIGPIQQEGHSGIGLFVVVPVTVKRYDQSLWKDLMIVQFRGDPLPHSCVVYGPYGLSMEME